MLDFCTLLGGYAVPLLLAQEKQPLIQRLDGATRAKVLAALGGLVILGFALVLLTWLGGRVTRRYMRGPQRYQPPKAPLDDDWIKKS
jgi:hypothetical protein